MKSSILYVKPLFLSMSDEASIVLLSPRGLPDTMAYKWRGLGRFRPIRTCGRVKISGSEVCDLRRRDREIAGKVS